VERYSAEVELDILADILALDWLYLIVVAPFIGSFLGVVAMRVLSGESSIFGRSACPDCGHRLAARDLIPILSWVLQRRRCRHCGVKVEIFYPVIEIGALLIAVAASWRFSGWLLWLSCGFGWMLLLIATIDYLWMLIPDELVLPLIPAGLAVAYLDGQSIASHVSGAAAGFLAFAAVSWLYRSLRRREGLGMGDAKFLAASGAWVSIAGLPSVVFMGGVAALLVVFVAALAGRQYSANDKVSFGSYLCLGTWLVWLFGPL
jgi:leader peptidase (prepilin peptidase)/N-methyltransferase